MSYSMIVARTIALVALGMAAGCGSNTQSASWRQASAAIADAPPSQRVAAGLVQENQTDIERWMEYARTCEQLNRYGGAIDAYNYVLVLNDRYLPAYEHLALVYLRAGEIESALEACRSGLLIDEQSASLWLGRGLCLCEAADYREALNSFQKAIQLAREPAIRASALLGSAAAYRRLGMDEEADRFEERAVQVDAEMFSQLAEQNDASTSVRPEERNR